ncbi:YceH family protein [Candidatus Magnetaquicoccus inordinatus]|uniref:YceH family protein n=1 Tax=Candidatus Magnetaquicoccus inordinatus TaxID=2496818 RepID=UPI00102AFFEF|nr:YceH family protein [Candidatus Magnetaquicoccus inordinatus]
MKELSADEVRVLAAMMEKEWITPEIYPLTLNALTNACNQKSNRVPVVQYDPAKVKGLVEGLCAKTLAIASDVPGSRVRKYRHFFTDRFKFVPAEAALLCELMLRGPQTLGELRGHASRLHAFPDVASVEQHIKNLLDVTPPWVVLLPLQPGKKEQRYMHTLMGMPNVEEWLEQEEAEERGGGSGSGGSLAARVAQLEEEVANLRQELQELRERFQAFQAQFE